MTIMILKKDLNKILANLNNIFWNDSKKSYSNELINNQIINTSNGSSIIMQIN